MEVYLELSLAHLTVSRRGRLSEKCLSTSAVCLQQTKSFSPQQSTTDVCRSLATAAKHRWILNLCFPASLYSKAQESGNKTNTTSLKKQGV